MYKFSYICFQFSWERLYRSEITESYGNFIFKFLKLNKFKVPPSVTKDTNFTTHIVVRSIEILELQDLGLNLSYVIS